MPGALGAPGLTVSTRSGVSAIASEDWARLSPPDASPCAEHGFFTALEDSGAVGPGTPWLPLTLVATDAGALVGAAPAYLKHDASGEHLDDRPLRAALEATGDDYEPRLVLATPYTPVGDRRLLVDPTVSAPQAAVVRRALLAAALDVARVHGARGVHLHYAHPDDLVAAAALGFAPTLGLTYRWTNAPYPDIAAFFARLPPHRRATVRRERRRLTALGVRVTRHAGRAIPAALLAPLPALFAATAARYQGVALPAAFFDLLGERLRPHLRLTLAWHDDHLIAAALDLEKQGRRLGRYWGCALDVDALHFEVCAYAPIHDCVARGVHTFDVGPGGALHKERRGFVATPSHHAAYRFDAVQHSALAVAAASATARARREIELSPERVFIR